MNPEHNTPLLTIVSGPPGTGKTTLAGWLARELGVPLIAKDAIKELLFDTLGWSDRQWSRKLGMATFALLYHFVEVFLAGGISHIVEANFGNEYDTPRFLELKSKYDFRALQILCATEREVLLARFAARSRSGTRHPGHLDGVTYDELKADLLKGRYEPLAIGGPTVEVDTTDFAAIDYSALLAEIRKAHAYSKGNLHEP